MFPQEFQMKQKVEKELLRHGNQKQEAGYSGIGWWWYGMPIYTNTGGSYGAISNEVTPDNINPSSATPVDSATSIGDIGTTIA